ncbi:hypothetical protein ACFVS9_07680 [Streptomyces sp. NPDC058008]|uniref:hypothetical protein n=1 Tax=Streptomyces sp. NPDC058008 TaxID=3346303 RepID=UPI0036EC6F99
MSVSVLMATYGVESIGTVVGGRIDAEMAERVAHRLVKHGGQYVRRDPDGAVRPDRGDCAVEEAAA